MPSQLLRPKLCSISCHCPMERTFSNSGASCQHLPSAACPPPPADPARVAGRLGAGSHAASPFVCTSWYDY